ncbi:TPM domain-containing protein [Hymenobacter terricola]|uniref:TPM domain-containing protein n=1 Tax=Hymenobacter terricola TaxID=2819236 RepID=UPI001B311A99|nr:TPM domain-containing protein [Hymenobacter terricola]
MSRFLFLVLLIFSAGLRQPSAAQTGAGEGLPTRPTPFRFVNDQAQLMAPADAKKLESGLRRYADNTGTQVVVVTVPTLGGRDVADYGRALGTAWGVGQRDKNNGIVVLVGAKEHKVTIQPGSGLQSTITPEVTSRVINEMTPGFKQGNYFAGLRAGLNTLMVTANPSSNPKKNPAAANSAAARAAGNIAATEPAQSNLSQEPQTQTPTNDPVMMPPASEPVSPGPGMGTLLIGALIIGGILWFVVRLFRGRSAASNAGNAGNGTPNFLPNQTNGPAGGGYGQAPGNYGPGYGNAPSSGGGMGVGGMLATGAAAAAGAYLGNRMASGHDTSGNNLSNDGNNTNFGAGTAAGAGAAGTAAAGDYFSSRDGGTADTASPDYFSDDNTAANNSDYFSSDDNNSSSDDTSSSDTGGGGFDSGSDNSGSW